MQQYGPPLWKLRIGEEKMKQLGLEQQRQSQNLARFRSLEAQRRRQAARRDLQAKVKKNRLDRGPTGGGLEAKDLPVSIIRL